MKARAIMTPDPRSVTSDETVGSAQADLALKVGASEPREVEETVERISEPRR